MTIEEYHSFCLSLPNTFEDFPFDQETMVFKVGASKSEGSPAHIDAKCAGKMFALTHITDFEYINLKVDPDESLKLQDKYTGSIKPGYHMNKKHWISVSMDESLPDELVEDLILNSYNLVKMSLPKKVRDELDVLDSGYGEVC